MRYSSCIDRCGRWSTGGSCGRGFGYKCQDSDLWGDNSYRYLDKRPSIGRRCKLSQGISDNLLIHGQGGQAVTRAEVKGRWTTKYNVNPRLSPHEKTAIYRALERWGGVFAGDPKNHREVKTTELVITLLDERPVRHHPLRISPEIEAGVAIQIAEMPP